MNQITSISQPAMPISLALAKSHLVVEHDLDNDYITTLLTAAVKVCQEYAWRIFSPAVVTEVLRDDSCMELQYNLTDVDSVIFTDSEDVTTTLTDGNHFDFITENDVTKIKKNDSWPSSTFKKLTVVYDTGYATDETPEDLIVACLLTLTDFYENRMDKVRKLTTVSRTMIDPHRRWQFR